MLISRKIIRASRWPKVLLVALKFLPIFALFGFISWHQLDPDFGWHLQTGNYIRHHGTPTHDIFSYPGNRFHWIDHEWGNDVLTYFFYGIGGYFLLSIIFGLLWTLVFVINGAKTGFITLLLAATAILPYAGIRPIAWTALFLVVLLKLIKKRPKNYQLWTLLLLLVWANLHGGFIVGLAVIAYFGLKERKKLWVYLLLAGVFVTFINPYGPRLYEEVYRTLADKSLHGQIGEWHIFSVSSLASLLYISLWSAGFWIYRRRLLKNWLGLGPLLLLAGFSASRNIPLFVAVTYKELNDYYIEFTKEIPRTYVKSRRLVLGGIAAIVLVTTGYFGLKPAFYPWHTREFYYPEKAVAYLSQHPCPGALFNSYNYGGYLIWKLPSQPVYIDGRMPTWKDASGGRYLDRYFSVLNDSYQQKSEFKRWNIKCALIQNAKTSEKLKDNLEKSGWQIRLRSNGSLLIYAPEQN